MKTAKAFVAALVAGLTAIGTGLDDGHLTSGEIWSAVIAVVVAYGATWTVPNKKEVDPTTKYPLPPIS